VIKKGDIAMINKERDTVGKLSSELLQTDTYADHSAGEQMQEQLKDYETNVFDCVARGKTCYSTDFYVVVITKRERLMQNVIRHYFFHRSTCPTPDYDQTVYKYNKKDDSIEFMWVIPAKPIVEELNAHKTEVDLSVSQLLKFVLEFVDGTLDKKARALNGEIIIVK
jgi:hypothetical protein